MANQSLKQKILIVDDAPANIKVLGEVLKEGYGIIVATNGAKALKLASGDNPPDLILLDIMMPEMDGYEVCLRLKNDEKTKMIPVIFLTAMNATEDETKGLELGAVDYITKPINPSIVKARVKTQLDLKKHQDHLGDMVRERTREVEETQLEIILRLARAAEFRDNETGYHVTRMSKSCAVLGRLWGFNEEDSEMLQHASTMHDVGKIGIPDSILLKPGRLTPEEFDIMKGHPTIGAELLSGLEFKMVKMARSIAYTHHEKWDGSGYPRGLAGEAIPIEGRISAICDVFDALTSKRPYKKAWTVEDAVKLILEGKGKHFEPKLVELFSENLDEFVKIKEQYED